MRGTLVRPRAFAGRGAETDGCVDHCTGIWQNEIKKQTNLAQVLLQRCIKSLVNRGIIKQVDDVKVSARMRGDGSSGLTLAPNSTPREKYS